MHSLPEQAGAAGRAAEFAEQIKTERAVYKPAGATQGLKLD